MHNNIYIINSFNDFIKIHNIEKTNLFISCEVLTEKQQAVLKNYSIQDLSSNKKIEDFSDDFLKVYINLISEISILNNNDLWWSSEMASKNPFTSNLPNILQNFINIDYILSNIVNSNEIVIIYSKNNILNESITKKYSLQNNKKIFKQKNLFFFIKKIKDSFNHIKNLFSLVSRLFICKKLINKIKFPIKDYILIKSHFFEKQISDDEYSDEFFKNLYDYNKLDNIIIIVHTHGNFKNICNKLSDLNKNNKIKIYPYEFFINYKNIFFSFFRIIFHKLKIAPIKIYNKEISDIIFSEYIRSGVSINSLIFLNLIENLYLSSIKITKTFFTYENRSWENMFIKGIRKFYSNARIIGYQHSVVYQASSGYFSDKKEIYNKPMPDKILTNGHITRAKILKHSSFDSKFIKTGCALRYDYLSKIKKISKNKISQIIVPLEGVFNVDIFVSKILQLAIHNKDLIFTIRPHPVLTWDELKNRIEYDVEKIKNVKISSNKSIIDDLKVSNMCIYWSSAACIEALKMGIPVIHYKINKTFSFDPLFNCKHLKWDIVDDFSFNNVIDQINKIDINKYEQILKNAENYINDYLVKVTKENIDKFINE